MNPIKAILVIAVATILTVYIVYPLVENPDSYSNSIDVIIIDGQSNAEYSSSMSRVNPLLIDLPVPDHKLLYYGTESGANYIYGGVPSTGIYEMNRDGYWILGGIEPTLAYTYSQLTGHDVLTINVAVGAQSITKLSPDGTYWQKGAECIAEALSMLTGYSHVNMVGWIMMQGEADKNMAVDTYKEHFVDLMNYFKSIGANECYLVKTREYYGGNATIAQSELVEEYGNVHMATTITDTFTETNGLLVNGDPIHYSQKGRNLVGTALGEYIADDEDQAPWESMAIAIPIVLVIGIILFAARIVVSRND